MYYSSIAQLIHRVMMGMNDCLLPYGVMYKPSQRLDALPLASFCYIQFDDAFFTSCRVCTLSSS